MNENHYSHLQFDKVTIKFPLFPQTGNLISNYLQDFLGQAWYRKVLQPMDIYQEYKNRYHTIKRINTIKIVFKSLMKVKRRLALRQLIHMSFLIHMFYTSKLLYLHCK